MKLDVPYFKQFNKKACQPACFQMIAKYWKRDINQKALFKKTRAKIGTDTSLIAVEMIKKGFSFVAYWNWKRWSRRIGKAEVKKMEKDYKKAIKAGMIHIQNPDVSILRKYLAMGFPAATEVCCNELYGNPKDKDYHLIVLVGYEGGVFFYHDPYPKLGGTFKKINEMKLKKAWGSLPLEVPNFYVIIPRVVITGTPCTGKSTVAKRLGEKLKMPVTHVTELIKKKKIGTKKGKEIEVDLLKLKKLLAKQNGILESHILCEFGLPNSIVFVLRCDPRVLEKRMEKRSYSKKKIRDNMECEALDYCSILAEKNYGKRYVFDVDTTHWASRRHPGAKTAKKILNILGKKARGDDVDFSGWLLR